MSTLGDAFRRQTKQDGATALPGNRAVSAGAAGLTTTGDNNKTTLNGDNVTGDQYKGDQYKIDAVHIHPPAPADQPSVVWPLRLGAIPLPASAFQPRPRLRAAIDAAPPDAAAPATRTHVLSGGAGVGKSQLAAVYANEAVADAVDLVLWVPAAEAGQVIASYAQAARLVGAAGTTGTDPEADAEAFLGWTATTDRSWLVVLDNVGDPEAMAPWWPTGSGGRVLATSRSQDARFSGGGRVRVTVELYASDECIAFLETRLAGEASAHLLEGRAAELAELLGRLPLALGHAATYMINEDLGAEEYLGLLRTGTLDRALPSDADSEGYGRGVAAALLLSTAAANAAGPAGLADPVLRIVALLDAAGHPLALWRTPVLLEFLGRHRHTGREAGAATAVIPVTSITPVTPVTPDEARSALRILHRYNLITFDSRSTHREIRIHALTARATREATPAGLLAELSAVAAAALTALAPADDRPDAEPDQNLTAVLRANTDTLRQHVPPAP
ncbi:hypothetical protein LG634_16760 [Streptomyces bambusae]|uniref:NB-ARC domain-containing protein n=1 Tax=Streptomyces bambusae TaxID=1550616 RepID=UPI001CFF316B|nr:NB-ARC domain-containing protein [Streptomyces bambusae]MCB5166484.1 hypothetical protein [Streptomyces bambusae]